MRRAAAVSASAFALLVLATHLSPEAASAGTAPPRREILVRGADPVKGLPFFHPNALPALVGLYLPESAAAGSSPIGDSARAGSAGPGEGITVWYTSEVLVLEGAWKRTDMGGSEAYLLAGPRGPVIVLRLPSYYLFFELPSDDSDGRAFVRAFDRKFSAFFANAATPAELSFPAFVDY